VRKKGKRFGIRKQRIFQKYDESDAPLEKEMFLNPVTGRIAKVVILRRGKIRRGWHTRYRALIFERRIGYKIHEVIA